MVGITGSQKVRIVGSQKYKLTYLNKVTNSCKICNELEALFKIKGML